MQITLVLLCLLVGYLLKKYKSIPLDSHKTINLWIIYVALPAVTFKYIPFIKWENDLLLPIAMAPILFLIGFGLLFLVDKFYFKLNKETFGAILLTMALGNTSFMGFPLTKAYLGNEGFKIAVICDEANFVVMSSFGILASIYYGNKNSKVAVGYLLKNILLFPSFIALILSITVLRYINLDFAMPIFDGLSATLIPMALFSIGLQLDFKNLKQDLKTIFFALSYKLFLAPLIILSIAIFSQTKGIIGSVSVFEAAMAPMATSAILASEYGLNTKFVNNALTIGIILSVITTYFWFEILTVIL